MTETDARKHADDLREVVRLLVTATTGVTDIVEAMHRQIGSGPAVLGRPLALPTRIITQLAYGSVRGVTRVVGGTLDLALARLAPFLGESVPGPERAALLAVLNGVLGDWLAAAKSPLAIPLRVKKHGDGKKVVVLVHGSSMNDAQWSWKGHHHGDALARDHGWTVATVHYNSGLPVLENGRLLAEALESLEADEVAIVAHSMGGLVARAACHFADTDGRTWRTKLRTFVTLGTPHRGSPIERAGHLLDQILPLTGYSAPLARLGTIRSAGVMDLRHGLDLPLPADVECHAVAAGNDVLVPIESAHGPIPPERCHVIDGIDHLQLLGSPEVYEIVRRAMLRE
jgi:hypothetical protein